MHRNKFNVFRFIQIKFSYFQLSRKQAISHFVDNSFSVSSLSVFHTHCYFGPLRNLSTTLGDSRISVIKDAVSNCPDLLTVQLLIMEATFLDQPQKLLERAHAHGHTHLQEIRQYASLFKVSASLMGPFSTKVIKSGQYNV